MKRAYAVEILVEGMAPQAHVADLRVGETMQRGAVHEYAAADSRAHRQIDQILDISARTPVMLSQRRGVHVGIETYRT